MEFEITFNYYKMKALLINKIIRYAVAITDIINRIYFLLVYLIWCGNDSQ